MKQEPFWVTALQSQLLILNTGSPLVGYQRTPHQCPKLSSHLDTLTCEESNAAVPIPLSKYSFQWCPTTLSPVKLQAWWVASILISHKWLSLHLCIGSQTCCLHPCPHDHCSVKFSLSGPWMMINSSHRSLFFSSIFLNVHNGVSKITIIQFYHCLPSETFSAWPLDETPWDSLPVWPASCKPCSLGGGFLLFFPPSEGGFSSISLQDSSYHVQETFLTLPSGTRVLCWLLGAKTWQLPRLLKFVPCHRGCESWNYPDLFADRDSIISSHSQ